MPENGSDSTGVFNDFGGAGRGGGVFVVVAGGDFVLFISEPNGSLPENASKFENEELIVPANGSVSNPMPVKYICFKG